MAIQQISKIIVCIYLLLPCWLGATEAPPIKQQSAIENPKPIIVLIHGLNMNQLSMKYLDHQFQKQGYSTAIFTYKSRKYDIATHAQNFLEFLQAIDGPKVIIAHSLGSLITQEAVQREPNLSITHVVTLAAPFQGSQTAQRINQLQLNQLLIGKTTTQLLPKHNRWSSTIPLGSIAGKRPFGATRIFIPAVKQSDGTVTIEETKIMGMTDHTEVDATHSGILFSDDAVAQCLNFMKYNMFKP